MFITRKARRAFFLYKKCWVSHAASGELNQIDSVKISQDESFINYLRDNAGIRKTKIKTFLAKNPDFINIDRDQMTGVFHELNKFRSQTENPLEYPTVFKLKPISICYRWAVMSECGFQNISVSMLSRYLNLMLRKNIKKLKNDGYLLHTNNVQARLVEYFTMWPTSPAMVENFSDDNTTLYEARMKVLYRYLELNIDLTPEGFQKALESYPRIKHRPFTVIDKVLKLLQSRIRLSDEKIKKNMGVLQGNPENLQMILNEVKTLAGVDVKEILNRRPSLSLIRYESFIKINQLLNDCNISIEAQQKCFEIYSLSYETIKSRIVDLQKQPEFKALLCHPRILRLVFHKPKADKRLKVLLGMNKRCISLNVLSGCGVHFRAFTDINGDGQKGTEITKAICHTLGCKESYNNVYSKLGRHPFTSKISIYNVNEIYENLITNFNKEDILENCFIFLYPWSRIKKYIYPLLNNQVSLLNNYVNENRSMLNPAPCFEDLKIQDLTRSQLLSLTLYLIERDFHFSGDGVWDKFDNHSFEKQHVEVLEKVSGKKQA